MQRRTTETRAPAGDTVLAPPPAVRDAQRASTVGTRRYHARTPEALTDFQRTMPRKLVVSALGLGSYLGDCTDAEDDRYRASVREAIASGINVLDTASNYRCQRSECAIGQAVVEAVAAGEVRRDELVVCTKGGYVALNGAPPASREEYDVWLERELFAPGILTPDELVRGGHSLSPRFLSHQLAQSRTNLGLSTIDLYYLHNPEEQLLTNDAPTFRAQIEAAFALLEERSASGDLAGYGIATWLGLRVQPGHKQHLSLADMVAIARDVGGTAHHFRAVQLPISLAMPEAARLPTQPLGRKLVTLLEAADALGLGVISSAPLMQGRLSNGLPDEVRALFPDCQTDAQRALKFASSLPGVTTVLAGMRDRAHVKENLGAWGSAS